MNKIIFSSEFFNIKDTLECGQFFRFKPFDKGYLCFSLDKCAYCYTQGDNTVIECEDDNVEYFSNYFDLKRDYSLIYKCALSQNIEILTQSANSGKGIRILNQNVTETLFSFIISQNNNIPRIKLIIERLCSALGEEKSFLGQTYYAFPSIKKMAEKDVDFYRGIGLGYRAEYIYNLAKSIENGFNVNEYLNLETPALKKRLISIYGVGPKVADCVLFFGYRKTDSFPVDTWIEKVYIENFNGKQKHHDKIANELVEKFGINSGYFQQYLFHYKRNLENSALKK